MEHGFPSPAIHDEFSYLLAGETYAEGRLTNPSPPVPESFQSFHMLVEPSYMSKYLPGVGLQLAVGFLLGHPIIGVWLTVGLIVLASYGMLLRPVGPRVALLAGVYCLVQYGLASYFGFSYWGGSLSLLAGVLVFGAALRLEERPDVWASIAYGMGASLMLWTRPVEGGLFCLVITLYLLIRMFSAEPKSAVLRVLRTFWPGGLVLFGAVMFLLVSNQAVTGDAGRFGYEIYTERFGTMNLFTWDGRKEISDDLPEVFQQTSLAHRTQRPYSISELLQTGGPELFRWFTRIVHPLWLIPVAFFLFGGTKKYRRWLVPIWILLLLRVGFTLAFHSSHHLHYTAAWAAPMIFAGSVGLWDLFQRWKESENRFGAIAFVSVFVAVLGLQVLYFFHFSWGNSPFPVRTFIEQRAEVKSRLILDPAEALARDLVFVQYRSSHSPTFEWVYNGPNLNEQEIIWARYLDDQKADQLSEAFPERRLWLLEVGSLREPYSLERYSPDEPADVGE
tara:strand:- start:13653 stop:15167 length:1515 start_codon:yes stop_codon:yes gene_type:complete